MRPKHDYVDEFTYFAGGHGDIMLMSTPETPVLEAETGIKTVTFGKYNYQRVPFFKRAGDPYWTLADIPEGLEDICVSGPTSNASFWGVLANEMHGLGLPRRRRRVTSSSSTTTS